MTGPTPGEVRDRTIGDSTRILLPQGGAALLALAALLFCGCNGQKEADHVTKPTAQQPTPRDRSEPVRTELATFGAGCFWGVEAAFRRVEGVVETTVGYSGGTLANPTYKDVCTDHTGHAEAVQVRFDPAKVSYDDLLNVFWGCHDPTTLNRQGPDIGTQYRSVIFYHDAAQKAAAEESKRKLGESGRHKRPIVTEIVPAPAFYPAEEYHQRYLEKRGRTSCATTVK